jgi:hypothetical protein
VNQVDRDCPDCRETGAFAQAHPDPGSCSDASDGICPEWYCIACGAAVLLGTLPAQRQPLSTAELTGRAA